MKDFTAIALLVLAGLQLSSPSQAIMRGAVVSASAVESLSTVAIHTPEALCTGAIVGPNLVVTAAHCLVRKGGYSIRFTGADGVVRQIAVMRTALHPEFVEQDGFSGADIGLLLTKAPFPEGMKVARFPGWFGGGSSLVIAGYGSTEKSRNKVSQLRIATMEGGEPAIPGRGFRGLSVADGAIQRGMCVGDSGGPVFSQGSNPAILVGILKGGTIEPGTACTSRPLYTPVSTYRNWIEAQAQRWNATLGSF